MYMHSHKWQSWKPDMQWRIQTHAHNHACILISLIIFLIANNAETKNVHTGT